MLFFFGESYASFLNYLKQGNNQLDQTYVFKLSNQSFCWYENDT